MSARKLAFAAIALCACKQTAPAQAPQISSFTAQPAAIVTGESATLSWQVTGATTLTIDNGVGDVSGHTSAVVRPTADTTYTLTAKDGSLSSQATASVHVAATGAAAASFKLEADASPVAGMPFHVRVTALDAQGHIVALYRGTVQLSSDDPVATAPAPAAFTSADAGVHDFTLTLATAGDRKLTAGDGSVTGTATIHLAAGAAISMAVAGMPSQVTAGSAIPLAVSLTDAQGNAASGYTGKLHFTSSDGHATLPADYTFTAADAGMHVFSVTLLTAGAQTVTAGDGSLSVTTSGAQVVAAAAASCAMSGVPSSTTTGTAFSPKVTLYDSFSNVAAGYTGKVHFTSADTLATLPADYTYQAADAGAHTFTNGAFFGTAGSQTLTATDTVNSAITCSGTSTVSGGATDHLVLSGLPASATAGKSVGFTVTVKQGTVTDSAYRGTISFSSSDGAASLTANYLFTSGDAGTHGFSVTFETPGSQTISAQDVSNAAITGSGGPVTVRGLVYTDPAAGGKIRLVRNSAFSGSTAVLDMVAASSLTGYFVGLDLPLDASKVAANASPISAGGALNPGAAPQALAAALPATGPLAGIFVSGLSQKAAGAGPVTTDASISSGQVFYTLRLDLAAAASTGTVFDGASLPASFRAGLRNKAGNETAAATDFAIGKLEVQ